ncbi:MAG TPA: SDR family oxidoreductase [Dehalococcoidia bacterium]|nr:SDR family oxidoreductase [Dehalococcoidia bacterium]
MKSIVITGSTSGIGLGLADAFLARDCAITIGGHSRTNLDKAYGILAAKHDVSRILAYLCDVSHYDEVQGLWNAAVERFGHIDIWINNAGAGHPQTPIWNYSHETIDKLVATNVTGALYGLNVASKGMMQQGFGSIYNMEGLGSSSRVIKGLALYSATKSALASLTTAAAKEVEGTPILVGGLRPGMVATKLITDQYEGHPEEWKRVERIFNILSDRVETVTPWLADKILSNNKNGIRIQWLSRSKVILRFLLSPFHKRTIFD